MQVEIRCSCPYCAMDAKVGKVHEICPYRIDVWVEHRVDGWYSVADMHDGEAGLQKGPFATEADALESCAEFSAAVCAALPGFRLVKPS